MCYLSSDGKRNAFFLVAITWPNQLSYKFLHILSVKAKICYVWTRLLFILLNLKTLIFLRMFCSLLIYFWKYICAYSKNNFAENASSGIRLTKPKKRAIDKNDCNVEDFVPVLFNGNITPEKLFLKQMRFVVNK